MALIKLNGSTILEGAKAALVAEHRQDRSDCMSDYHGHHVTRRIVLAWSTTTRDLFPEMREAARLASETRYLADCGQEHREKYSMGGGYYLKHGSRHENGWSIEKYDLKYYRDILTDILKEQFPPEAAPAAGLSKLEALDRVAALTAPAKEEEFKPTRFKVWIHLEALDQADKSVDVEVLDAGEFESEENAACLASYLLERAQEYDRELEEVIEQ